VAACRALGSNRNQGRDIYRISGDSMSRTKRNHGRDADFWMREKKDRDKKPIWKPDGISKRIAHRQFRARVRDAMYKDMIPPEKHMNDLRWNWL
jgi:hypothetical protein